MFVDLKRAFDTVDPVRLERKLKRIGLSEQACRIISSYLGNRLTATTIGDQCSLFRRVLIGIAQGSKLGPLTFIIYVNDLLGLGFIGNILLFYCILLLQYYITRKTLWKILSESCKKMLLSSTSGYARMCLQ